MTRTRASSGLTKRVGPATPARPRASRRGFQYSADREQAQGKEPQARCRSQEAARGQGNDPFRGRAVRQRAGALSFSLVQPQSACPASDRPQTPTRIRPPAIDRSRRVSTNTAPTPMGTVFFIQPFQTESRDPKGVRARAERVTLDQRPRASQRDEPRGSSGRPRHRTSVGRAQREY